jgi:hypothetical protein
VSMRPIQTRDGLWYVADVPDELPDAGYSMITLLHHRKDEPSRMRRMRRVVSHVLHHSPGTLAFILALHDHKGTLSVNWRTRPSPSALVAVVSAWKAESEYSTNHFVCSQPLLGDTEMADWPADCEDAHQTIGVNRLVRH